MSNDINTLVAKLQAAAERYAADPTPARAGVVTRYRNALAAASDHTPMEVIDVETIETEAPAEETPAIPAEPELAGHKLIAMAARNRDVAAAAHARHRTPETLAHLDRMHLRHLHMLERYAPGPSPEREPVEPAKPAQHKPTPAPMAMRFGSPTWSNQARAHTDKSLRWFRAQLNERAWPKSATARDKYGSHYGAAKARLDGLAKARQVQNHRLSLIQSDYDQIGFSDEPTHHVGGYYHDGWPTVAPFTTRPKPSDRRPMSANVLWQTWLKDGDRTLVLVSSAGTGKVVTENKEGVTVVRKSAVTEYWVTLAESVPFQIHQFVPMLDKDGRPVRNVKGRPRFRFDQPSTDRAMARLNAEYFPKGVPFVGKSATWQVLEPVEDVLGPFTTEDAARTAMTGWQSELDDDFADNHERGSGLVYAD